jgi:hypothetical protein
LHWDPAGNHPCPARVGHPPGPSVARSQGDLWLRSVHRADVGRAIESRKLTNSREPTLSELRKATPRRPNGKTPRSRRGPRTGHASIGVLQEPWEILSSPPTNRGRGTADQNPGPGRCVPRPRERIGDARVVPPSEGNEARREGRQGVAVSRMTREVGELSPRGPRGGKETPEHGTA